VIAVTGATGAVGGRVAQRLAERGAAQRLIGRDPARAPELEGAELAMAAGYSDSENMRRALDGADTLFMVSGREQRGRVAEHAAAVDAAVAAGVGRIVYLSFFGAAPDCTFTFGRDHFHTEQHIRAAGIPFTFLRDNLYLDFIPFFCGEDGVIRGPAGDGRAGFVARADVADVAAEVLTGDGHEGRALRADRRRVDLAGARRRAAERGHRPRDPLPRRDHGGGARLAGAERRAGLGDRGLGDDLRGHRRGRARRRHRRGRAPCRTRALHRGTMAP
jgi:uncharacterized protein YbjT (DUF2867 family)